MEEIVKFLKELGFSDISPEPLVDVDISIKDGENVIGEMNYLEKILYSLIDKKRKENKELIPTNQPITFDVFEKIRDNEASISIASGLLRLSVNRRLKFSRHLSSAEFGSKGLRRGWVIVETIKDIRDEAIFKDSQIFTV